MAQFGYQVAGFGAGGEQGITLIDVGSIDFDGSSSKIEYTNNFFRFLGGPMNTSGGSPNAQGFVSFWIKPDAITSAGSKPIMQIGTHDGTPSIRLAYNYSGGGATGMFLEAEFVGSVDEAGTRVLYTTAIGSITGNAWQHIALGITDGNITNIFIDGASVSSFGSSGSGADTAPADTENTVFGFDGSAYGNFCLAEVFIDGVYRNTLSDLNKFISKVADASSPTVKPSPIGKPVRLPSDTTHYYLTGTASSWANQGTNSLGTQTLTSITDCADSPSD